MISAKLVIGRGGKFLPFPRIVATIMDLRGWMQVAAVCVQTLKSRLAIEREALLALLLDHPNILMSYAQVINDSGTPWGSGPVGMAMQYLQGEDLYMALE
jgi:hypothetical protein